MKPNFFVFCESESKIAYIKPLRSQYRAPLLIIPRKSNSQTYPLFSIDEDILQSDNILTRNPQKQANK